MRLMGLAGIREFIFAGRQREAEDLVENCCESPLRAVHEGGSEIAASLKPVPIDEEPS
jgi:hypothetical protein